MAKPADIRKENQELRKKLSDYEALEEDLMARRVFDKARKLLTTYLTVGGLVILLAGVVGIKSVVDYAKNQVQEKIAAISEEQITTQLQEEGRRQITLMVKQRETDFIQIAQQQVTRIVTAANPIRTLQTAGELAPSPPRLDLSAVLPPVRNQGNEGGSVGFAVAAALEYHVSRVERKPTVISPRFIYYYARKKGGFPTDGDTGSRIRDAVAVLAERGAVSEQAWPYKAGEFAADPPADLATATHYKIKNVQTVGSIQQLKSALTTQGPVPGALTLFKSGGSVGAYQSGRFPMPLPDDEQIGGHAICFVGFDDEKKLFKIKNSWGIDWGDNGYGYVPYEYVERFLSDAWTFTM